MKKKLPTSFVRFHAVWLDEWYVANRQYRQAHEFIRYFFPEQQNLKSFFTRQILAIIAKTAVYLFY